MPRHSEQWPLLYPALRRFFWLPEPCEMEPLYSECAIYRWECERCKLNQFGRADEQPGCASSARQQYCKWSDGKG